MRIFIKLYLFFTLVLCFHCFAQTDSLVQEEFDTVFVQEAPIVVTQGTLKIFEDHFSKAYMSLYFPMSYDFNWYRSFEGYEYYLDKVKRANRANYSRGVGVGFFYIKNEKKKYLWNFNAVYNRYYEAFWYSPTWRSTNMFDFVGLEAKRGKWIWRHKKMFSMILSVGYGLVYNVYRRKGTLYTLDKDYDNWIPLSEVDRYRRVQNYLSVSTMCLFRMNRARLGVEPYFHCHLRNFTKDYQPYKQALMQAGLKISLMFGY